MKTYVLIISPTFPKSHRSAGDITFFKEKIITTIRGYENNERRFLKLHTIRGNYDLWRKRFDKIEKGEAYLSIREWRGMPYRSKQIELLKLYNTDGIGLQKLNCPDNIFYASIEGKPFDWDVVAKNDGLFFQDFCDWFKTRQKEPMAIIHFTKFRY